MVTGGKGEGGVKWKTGIDIYIYIYQYIYINIVSIYIYNTIYLEEGMVTHPSVLAWRVPWTEETDGLQSMGSQGVGAD